MNPAERKAAIEAVLERARERLEREWPEGDAHINELEDLSERVFREAMRELTRELLREQSGRRSGNQVECACGERATYRADYWLTLVTAHGRIPVKRAYYYCTACRQGHCPLDLQWGIGPAHTTPTVQAMAGALSGSVAYCQVPALLRRFAPVHLGITSVERIAQALGERVKPFPPRVAGVAQRPVVLAVDGVMVPIRRGQCQEARLAVLYEPDERAPYTKAGQAHLKKEYLATLESRETLMRAACERAHSRLKSRTDPVVVLGDGAKWIWDWAAQLLPYRVEILDFFHVSERVWSIAVCRYGSERQQPSKAAQEWVKQMEEALHREGPEPLLAWLRAWEPETAAAREVKRAQLGYFEHHQERMNYPEEHRQGYPVGSGAVEGACRHVVADRFRCAGMRWNAATAEPLLHLRAALLTDPNLDLRPYVSTCSPVPIALS